MDYIKDNMLKLLISEKIIIALGGSEQGSDKITIYQVQRTPQGGNVIGFFDDAVPLLSSFLRGGKVESFERGCPALC